VIALFLLAAPMAYGAAGDVGGSFAAKNKLPEVTALTAPDMTPQQEWTTITVTVEDKNKLIDVQEVHVEVFYDSIPSNPAAPGVANVQTCGILTWARVGGWSIAPAATTWGINGTGCSKPVDTLSSGDWVFSFKVDKVATESPGADNWDAYAKARDTVGWGTVDRYDRDQEMNWYGEVTAITANANFGDVDPGTGFSDNVNVVDNISINYISNGAYDEQVKSSAAWAGGTYTANFDATGACGTANQFSLMADDAATYPGGAVQVTLAGALIDDTGAQTNEDGSGGGQVTTNTLWLKLADVFNSDTYTGTITYIIVDGS
jgi:hypothetical protein